MRNIVTIQKEPEGKTRVQVQILHKFPGKDKEEEIYGIQKVFIAGRFNNREEIKVEANKLVDRVARAIKKI